MNSRLCSTEDTKMAREMNNKCHETNPNVEKKFLDGYLNRQKAPNRLIHSICTHTNKKDNNKQ